MDYTTINCYGAMIEVYSFLKPLWPFQLPLNKWPSYCGAGDGIGDLIVPERLHGVCISPACFQHDLEWTLCENTYVAFMKSNWRLYKNLRSLITYNLTGTSRVRAEIDCLIMFEAVSRLGKIFFKKNSDDQIVVSDPLKHPTVQKKLRRLAQAVYLK